MEAVSYRVTGMTCGGCVRAVTNALRTAAPAASVAVDLPKGLVTVGGLDEVEPLQQFGTARAGFQPGQVQQPTHQVHVLGAGQHLVHGGILAGDPDQPSDGIRFAA